MSDYNKKIKDFSDKVSTATGQPPKKKIKILLDAAQIYPTAD